MTIALFPGSFDPVHNGHLEVLDGACRLFDTVIMAPFNGDKDRPLFELAEREEMLREAIAGRANVGKANVGKANVGRANAGKANVQVVSFNSLVVDLARDLGASVLVRGLRAVSDFESELQMAQMNYQLSGIDTVFIPTSSSSSFLASRLIREIARYGGEVSGFVPEQVALRLRRRFDAGSSVGGANDDKRGAL